jgi:hypothetical protein
MREIVQDSQEAWVLFLLLYFHLLQAFRFSIFLTDTSAISVRAKNPLQIVNKIMIQSSKNGKKLGLGSMGKDKIFWVRIITVIIFCQKHNYIAIIAATRFTSFTFVTNKNFWYTDI